MRYEILRMLHHATRADPERRVDAWHFAADLGVWQDEVWNVLVWLQHAGMVTVHDARPTVAITLRGVQYIERDASRRRTVRGLRPPDEHLG